MPAEFVVSKPVVTGGAQGLGAAVARRLAGEGMPVPLLDIKADRAKDDNWDQVIAVNMTGCASDSAPPPLGFAPIPPAASYSSPRWWPTPEIPVR